MKTPSPMPLKVGRAVLCAPQATINLLQSTGGAHGVTRPTCFAMLTAAALFTHAAIAGKPTPPPPPPPSSGTLVLDYLGLEGTGAANFGLTVAPSGAIYASGVSGEFATVLASGDSGNSWSLADIFPPPGRYVTYLQIAGGITSDAAGNLYVTGWTWDDAAVRPAEHRRRRYLGHCG